MASPIETANEGRRWLCVCTYGHSRSVALVRELHHHGIPAVACGHATAGDGLYTLSGWADVIALVAGEGLTRIPENCRHKVVSFDVGPDRWSNPYNAELAGIMRDKLNRYFAAEG